MASPSSKESSSTRFCCYQQSKRKSIAKLVFPFQEGGTLFFCASFYIFYAFSLRHFQHTLASTSQNPFLPPPSQRDVSLSRRGSGRRCDGSTVKPTQSTNSTTTTTLATPLCAAFEEIHTERRKENIISLAVFPFVFLSFFDAAMALNPSRQMPSPVVGGGSLSTREFSPSLPQEQPGTAQQPTGTVGDDFKFNS